MAVTIDDINMLDYFIREKGDITRWTQWDSRKGIIKAEYPELIKALDDAIIAERILETVVDKVLESFWYTNTMLR